MLTTHLALKPSNSRRASLIGQIQCNLTPSTTTPRILGSEAVKPILAMPICIECRYPVSALYTTYSKADDKALGKGVRLTQCPRCKRFADKYVEHDFVVLFIDLVLIKPQVGHLSRWSMRERGVVVAIILIYLSPPAPTTSQRGFSLLVTICIIKLGNTQSLTSI